jgi:subfamily B ATP-binding cassette protein MsbA
LNVGLIIATALTEGFSVLLIIPMLEGLGQDTQGVANNNAILREINGLFANTPDDQLLQTVALIFLGVTVLRAVVGLSAAALEGWLQSRLDRQLREEVYEQILSLALEDLNQRRDADWHLLLNSETGRAARVVFVMVGVASSLVNMFIYVGLLFIVSWQMTLLAGILLGLVFAGLSGLVRLADWAGKGRLKAALAVQHRTTESVNAKRLIRLMHQQDFERQYYRGLLKDFQKSLFYLSIVGAASKQLVEVLVIALLALLLILSGSLLNLDQAALLPIISTFILILYRMLPHILALNNQRTQVGSELAAVRVVVRLLDHSDKVYIPDGHLPFEGLRESIRFEGVNFHYAKRDSAALGGVSFEIQKGQTVALVGFSGSGKSTVADLLNRLYDPQSGRILVDGQDLRHLRLADWRKHIGVVSQDTYLFNASIAYNIRYGHPGCTQAEVEQAARYANIHDFIAELPQGYETMVGDRGVLLSGGQRQRIAIARAILRDPQILILDEATAALDSHNEQMIQAALDELSQHRTVLVIAHRFSTIVGADKIVVMDGGKIVEQGSHEALLAQAGVYAHLYQWQAGQSTAYAPEVLQVEV